MKQIVLSFFILLLILMTGCGKQPDSLQKKSSIQFKNSSIELTKNVKALNINVDSGNITIFCWDEPDIKFEIKHTVRDYQTEEQLAKRLEKFSTETKTENGTCFIEVDYEGKIKEQDDVYSDVKLTIPRRIKELTIHQDSGSLRVEDKYQGGINAELVKVNTEIKSLYGLLNLQCEEGNIRLNSGILSNDSLVKVNSGNINIKTACQNNSVYTFQTNRGNVDLTFPKDAPINMDVYGTVTNNQFTGMEGNIAVIASTKFGKISVNGY